MTTTNPKTRLVWYARVAALAGLAVTAVAAGLLATPAATAPASGPGTGADAGVRIEHTPTPGSSVTPAWASARSVRISADGVRIRTRPAPDGVIFGLIASGATISVRCTDLGRAGDLWGDATYHGIRGWVNASMWQPAESGQKVPRCGTR